MNGETTWLAVGQKGQGVRIGWKNHAADRPITGDQFLSLGGSGQFRWSGYLDSLDTRRTIAGVRVA